MSLPKQTSLGFYDTSLRTKEPTLNAWIGEVVRFSVENTKPCFFKTVGSPTVGGLPGIYPLKPETAIGTEARHLVKVTPMRQYMGFSRFSADDDTVAPVSHNTLQASQALW